jgi:hypothetical protein
MSHWAQDCPMLDGVACEEHGRPPAPRPITLTREQGEEIEYALNRGANLVDEECGQGTATSDYLRSALSVLRTAMEDKR